MEIGDGFFAVFSANERINKLHWARAIERNHSDDILERAGFEVFEIALHAGRFKLENTGSFGTLE